MPDTLTPAARSAHVRRIRMADTKPELAVRRAAHKLGYRFRLHRRNFLGTPDLVFSRLRKITMVHDCFWHQHPGCRLARLPKSRRDYWLPKLQRNRERDAQHFQALAERGWKVLVVWECQAGSSEVATEIITPFPQQS